MALKGYKLRKAIKYLHQVIDHKAAVPFRRFNGGVGRHTQSSLYRNCAAQVSVILFMSIPLSIYLKEVPNVFI